MFYTFGVGDTSVKVDARVLEEAEGVRPATLGVVIAWLAARGGEPFSYGEMGEALRPLGCSSRSRVSAYLRALEDEGVIERRAVDSRVSVEIVDKFHVQLGR